MDNELTIMHETEKNISDSRKKRAIIRPTEKSVLNYGKMGIITGLTDLGFPEFVRRKLDKIIL